MQLRVADTRLLALPRDILSDSRANCIESIVIRQQQAFFLTRSWHDLNVTGTLTFKDFSTLTGKAIKISLVRFLLLLLYPGLPTRVIPLGMVVGCRVDQNGLLVHMKFLLWVTCKHCTSCLSLSKSDQRRISFFRSLKLYTCSAIHTRFYAINTPKVLSH